MSTIVVGDLMTFKPITVLPSATLREVLVGMREEGVRQLPVVDEQGKLLGIITDRDLRLAVNAPLVLHDPNYDEAGAGGIYAASCMTPDPITVTPDTPAYRAAEMLTTYKFGALPVVEGELLVGILSASDILNQFAAEQRQRAHAGS